MSVRKTRTVRNRDQYGQFVELLREIRLRAGLRQTDVAGRLNLPQSFISKYESGERRLDIFELRLVCRALGLSLSDFVGMLEERIKDKSLDET